MAGPERVAEHVLDGAVQALLDGLADFLVAARGIRAAVAAGARQQLAAIVDDADILRLEARHRRGHQVQDRLHLVIGHALRAGHRQHHGGLCLLLLAGERLALRQHQVDAGIAHAVNGSDGARQLAFQRAQLIDLLLELARCQAVATVEQLVADRAAGRQAFARQRQAQPVDLVARHHDLRTAALDLVGDPQLVQHGGDLGGIAQLQIAVQQRHRLAAAAQCEGDHDRQHGQADGGDPDQPGLSQTLETFEQPAHRPTRDDPDRTISAMPGIRTYLSSAVACTVHYPIDLTSLL